MDAAVDEAIETVSYEDTDSQIVDIYDDDNPWDEPVAEGVDLDG